VDVIMELQETCYSVLFTSAKKDGEGCESFGFSCCEVSRIEECILLFLSHRGEEFLILSFRALLYV